MRVQSLGCARTFLMIVCSLILGFLCKFTVKISIYARNLE